MAIACHFKDRQTLCETTIARVKRAIEIARPGDDILMTGHVPYEIGGPMLCDLMYELAIKEGFPCSRVYRISGGVDTFSEARLICESPEAKVDHDEAVIVTSLWYWFNGDVIWEARAKENHVPISVELVPNTAGMRPWLIYIPLGVATGLSFAGGFDSWYEQQVVAKNQDRNNGFTLNGCR